MLFYIFTYTVSTVWDVRMGISRRFAHSIAINNSSKNCLTETFVCPIKSRHFCKVACSVPKNLALTPGDDDSITLCFTSIVRCESGRIVSEGAYCSIAIARRIHQNRRCEAKKSATIRMPQTWRMPLKNRHKLLLDPRMRAIKERV
jgi:hypothetical protein